MLDWFKRRWWEFRQGHNVYLSFILGFIQFILIFYAYLPQLHVYFTLTLFAIVFLPSYGLAATILGHWHVKNIVPTEAMITAETTPYCEKILDGKEQMSNDYSIENIGYFKFQGELVKKNMTVLNWLMERLDAPKELFFSNDDFGKEDEWLARFEAWRQRFIRYSNGEKASNLRGDSS